MIFKAFFVAAFASSATCAPTMREQEIKGRAPAKFIHPGVLVSGAQLDFVKQKVNASSAPWSTAYKDMQTYDMAKLTYKANPVPTVRCIDGSNPDIGCEDEQLDALAAYSMALQWAISGNKQYAQKAIEIMDTWSGTIKEHTGENAPLQTGWAASSWTRAAEIIRYTNAGWSSAGIEAFKTMLSNVYMPLVKDGSSANENNWDLVMLEAAQGIAIFLEDAAAYDNAMVQFKDRVPAYIYLEKDGAYPLSASDSKYKTKESVIRFWQGDSYFIEGRAQETCRDLEHVGYGISSISHMMETARIQGEDLYTTEMGTRLQKALELHSKYGNGGSAPSNLCGGTLKYTLLAVTEIGFNALSSRLGISMPSTQSYTLSKRPSTSNWLFTAWETLTHANNST